ncbi:MAG: TolC family protein [Planctomycetota bacterium]|nr:TolC family protein [Planctomycetota bacterium]
MVVSFRCALLLMIFSPAIVAQDKDAISAIVDSEVSTSVGSESLDLSLDDAIGLALDHNLDLEIQRIGERRNQWDPLIAEAAFDPLFRTGYTISKSSTTSTSIIEGAEVGQQIEQDNRNYFLGLSGQLRYGTTWNVRLNGSRFESSSTSEFFSPLNYRGAYQLSLSQPLLRGFGRDITETSLRVAVRNALASRLATRRSVETTVASVVGSYWDLVYTRRNVAVQESALAEARELLEINRRRLEVGTGTEIDVISAEANIETQKAGIIDSVNQLRDIQDVLLDKINAPGFRVGGDSGPLFRDVEVVPTTPLELAEFPVEMSDAVQMALASRLELVQQDLQIANSEDQLRLSEDQLKPSLTLDGGWTQPGNDISFDGSWSNIGEDYNWSAGLNFEIPLGNRAARNRLLQSREDLRMAQISRDQASHGIVLEVTRAVRELQSARQSVETNAAATHLRREELDGETRRLEVGVSTAYQVLQVQNSLLQAQVSELQAQVRLRKAIAAYRNATGTILKGYGIELD